jgi:hypothetical protein
MPNKPAIRRREMAQATIKLHRITTKITVFSYEMITQSFHEVTGSSTDIYLDLVKRIPEIY